MTISKSIIERLGGEIWIESELGRGTTVFFTVPKADHVSDTKTEKAFGHGSQSE